MNINEKASITNRILDNYIINPGTCILNQEPIKHRLLRLASDFHKLFIYHS